MEQWRPVFDRRGRAVLGYQVSNLGRIRTYWTSGPHASLVTKPSLRKPSYAKRNGKPSGSLVLCVRVGRRKYDTFQIDVLVATAFIGPRPRGGVLDHINGVPDDNRARNLRWVTRSESSLMAVARTPRRPLAKLTPAKVRAIRASKLTAPELAEKYGVEKKAIYNIKWGVTWRDV
ncbi:MAG: HNH endonuclease [Phycisphaeraceae bacterium]|nr:HNH endonuclease [Phycisphaeraceae bacterium]